MFLPWEFILIQAGSGMPMAKKQSDADNITIQVPKEIKDVVGYEWNGLVYKTKLDAQKAKAEAELHKLFPRNIYSHAYPMHSNITHEYEKVIKILSEIKE